MTRKVQEIDPASNSLQIQARINDNYIRPAGQQDAGSIEQIASTLVDINPAVTKYLTQKTEKKENFDVAQGMMIYRKQLAEGKDLTGEEIKAEIAAGNIEGYAKINKNHLRGIYRARHEKTGAELKKHMLEYTATAKLPNEKGELVPVSQITDQDAVMTAFLGEAERYILESTGGKYDPVLYDEYIKPEMNEATTKFINTQAEERIKQHTLERHTLGASILDSTILPLVQSKEFEADKTTGRQIIKTNLEAEAARLISEGRTETETAGFLVNYLQTVMQKIPYEHYEQIEQIAMAAEDIEILKSPIIQNTLKETMNNVQTGKYYEYQRLENIKEEENMQKASDLWDEGERTGNFTAFDKFVSTVKNKGYFLKARSINLAYDEARTEMPFETYRTYQIQADQGRLSFVDVQMLAPKMSKDQLDNLKQSAKEGATRARVLANQSGSSQKEASKKLEKALKQVDTVVAKYFKGDDVLKPAEDNNDTRANVQKLQATLTRIAYSEYSQWLATEGAAADSILREDKLHEIVSKHYSRYKGMYDIYVKDPQLIHSKTDPKKIKADHALEAFRQHLTAEIKPEYRTEALNKAMSEGNVKAVEKAIRKSNPAATNPRSTAQQLIKSYAKADKNKME